MSNFLIAITTQINSTWLSVSLFDNKPCDSLIVSRDCSDSIHVFYYVLVELGCDWSCSKYSSNMGSANVCSIISVYGLKFYSAMVLTVF